MKRSLLLVIVVAFAGAILGTLMGRSLSTAPAEPVNELHVLLYEKLDLTSDQLARLKALERSYADEKALFDHRLRSENALLAHAIETEHGYGPDVDAAVDRSHRIMGDLQKITLEHIFAMRSVLTSEQARRYDAVVTKLLVDGGK